MHWDNLLYTTSHPEHYRTPRPLNNINIIIDKYTNVFLFDRNLHCSFCNACDVKENSKRK